MATVRDIMEVDPVTVTPEDSVETVIRTLRENELPGVPVVNNGGRCVGIVTEADLVLT
jgi:CBS domain-containing protein